MQKGKIIYLNGVSGAGKTTLTRALQEKLDEPYFMLNQDCFDNTIAPKKFWVDSDEGNTKWGKEVFMLLHKTAKAYADIGINSIIDVVIVRNIFGPKNEETEYFYDVIKLLNGYPVFFVHVFCPFDELHRRKTNRGDTQADKWLPLQFEHFYPKEPYDVTVNTFENTAEECAEKIIMMMSNSENFKAFKSLFSASSK